MPQVGAFFAGMFSAAAPAIGSATFGAWAAGAGVSGFLTTTVLGRLLSTVALTALSRALAPKPTVPGIRTTQTLTGGVTPESFILGRYATEGQLVCPPMSHGRDGGTPNAYLTYVIELGDVPGQTLEGVIVDGRACVPDLDNPHADYGFPLPELSESRTRTQVVGSDPVDGYPIYDEVTTETPTAWVRYYDGTQVAADPMLMDRYGDYPERPWTADMVGTGICYAILTFRLARAIYTGFPQVRFVLGGIPLYDPRADDTAGGAGPQRREDPATWTPSENPAVQVYNILRGIALPGGHVWGGDMAAEDLPAGSWFAAMTAADAPVALDEEGASEPAWRSAYEVFVADEPAGVIEELLKPCSGQLAEIGGVWKIRLGGPGLPVFFFSDADVNISDSQQFDPFPALADTYNGVHASYPDPDALWNSVDAPPRYDASAEAADGHRRLIADLSLPACPYANQVQRVMRAYLEEERRMRRHVLTLAPEAIPLEPLDAVAWSSARNGYEAKIFEVVTIVDPLVTSKPQLSLRERDPADYDWQPGFALPVSLPSPATVPALPLSVGLWSVAPTSLRGADGTARRPGLLLSWQGADRDEAAGLRYRVRLAATQEVVATGQTEDATEGARVISEGVLPDTDYQVRVAWAARDDRESLWSDWAAVTTPDTRLAPPDLDPGVQGALSDAVSARADLDALTDGYTGTLAGTVAGFDGVIAGLEATLASVSGDLTDLSGAYGALTTGFAGTLSAAVGGLAAQIGGLDQAVLDARTEAAMAIAPLGVSVPRAPWSAWTMDPTSTAAPALRPAAEASRFVTDDAVFGECFELGPQNQTLAAAYPLSFDPEAVYRVDVTFRVTDAGSTGGVRWRIGATTFAGGAIAESNIQSLTQTATLADGVVTASLWISASLQKLQEAELADYLHLAGSGSASRAWFHLRANVSGDSDGILRVASLAVRDVTAALEVAATLRSTLSAELGQVSAALAQDYYTITETDQAITAAGLALQSSIGAVAADLATNYYTRASADGAIAGAITSYHADLTGASGALGLLSADLETNYYTSTQTDSAIAGEITSYNAALLSPAGAVGAISADLASNYYTIAGTGSAIASSVTDYHAQLVGASGALGLLAADLNTNHYTITEADQAIAGSLTEYTSSLLAPGGAIGALSADLAQNYYTRTEADSAIAGQITSYDAQLTDPAGALGSLSANLTQNYLTRTETGTAIALAAQRMQARSERRLMAAAACLPQICMVSGSYEFAAFEDGTVLYRDGARVLTLDRGEISALACTRGERFTSDKPFVASLAGNPGYGTPLGSEGMAGTRFAHAFTRDTPVTTTILPLASGRWRARTGPVDDGDLSAEPWQEMAAGTFIDLSDSSSGEIFVHVETTAHVLVHRRGGGTSDGELISPAAPELMALNDWPSMIAPPVGVVVQNSGAYYASSDGETLLWSFASGDGAGSDAETHMPVAACGDEYCLAQTGIADYFLATMDQPSVITVTDRTGTMIGTHALAAFDTLQIGLESGAGAQISSEGPFYFSGSAPFFLRANKTSDEFVAVGYRRAARQEVESAALTGAINDIRNLETNALTGTAFATMLQALQVDAAGNSAFVTLSGTALANLEGYLAASASLTAELSGGQIAGLRATVYDGAGGASPGALLELIGDTVIAPGTISTSRLVVADLTNFAAGCDFETDAGIPFDVAAAGFVLDDTVWYTGARSLRISHAAVTAPFFNDMIVSPGSEIYAELRARKSPDWDGDGANAKLRFGNNTTGANSYVAAIPLGAGDFGAADSWEHKTLVVTVPAGCTRLSVSLMFGSAAASAGSIWLDGIVIRHRNGGELIVDGAITGDHVASQTLSSEHVLAGGIAADRLAIGMGGNLIEDPVWATGLEGVGSWTGNAAVGAETLVDLRPPGQWAGVNFPTMMVFQDGTTIADYYLYLKRVGAGYGNGQCFPVEPGQWYDGSAHLSTHRCGGQLQIRWRDGSGTDLGGPASVELSNNLAGSSGNPDAWARYGVRGQAPSGAVMGQVVLRKYGTNPGEANSYVFVHKPMLAQTHAHASASPPWSPGGQTTIAGDQIRTGAIRSANFVSGVAGWSIDTVGNAEFNSLIARGALIDGAASDGGAIVAHAGGVVAVQNTVAAVLATGPLQHGQLWQIGVMSEYRRHSSYSYEAKTTVTVNVETRFRVQTRVKSAGVWSGWATEFTAPYSSGPVWTSDNSLFSRMGSFEDMEIRLLCELSATPDPATPGQNNIRNASVFARALER